MRTDKLTAPRQHEHMSEALADALFDRAVDLAYEAFGDGTTDDHVETVFARLAMQWHWGAGVAGATTVH